MPNQPSLLDELRTQYEAARQSTHEHADVEGFQAINARLRKAFRWLDKAITYLDGLKPAIDHRFDLGHGLVFETPRFGHGSVGQHERRIVGFPVLDEINIYYEIATAKPLAIEVAPGGVRWRKRRSTTRGCSTPAVAWRTPAASCASGALRCRPRFPPPSLFRVDYQTGIVTRGADQRRPFRPRNAGIPQQCDRRACARRPDTPHPWPRLGIPAPRAAGRFASPAVRLIWLPLHKRY